VNRRTGGVVVGLAVVSVVHVGPVVTEPVVELVHAVVLLAYWHTAED